MTKEFIPHEQALVLKELGFNEPCFGYRDGIGHLMIKETPHCAISAPTFSQAFRWFRERYNLKAYIIPIEYLDGTQETYQWNIFNECHSGVEQLTYEEAELACLQKLIQIVKDEHTSKF
jgi:hypothetical protein